MPKVTYRLETVHNKRGDQKYIQEVVRLRDQAIRNGDVRSECRYLGILQGLYFDGEQYEDTIAVSEQILLKSGKPEDRFVSYHRIANSLLELQDFDRAAQTAQKYIRAAQDLDAKREMFDANHLLGFVYLRKS